MIEPRFHRNGTRSAVMIRRLLLQRDGAVRAVGSLNDERVCEIQTHLAWIARLLLDIVISRFCFAFAPSHSRANNAVAMVRRPRRTHLRPSVP